MTKHTTLHINCAVVDKSSWMLTARASGIAFEDWVAQQLNTAAIDTNPAWAYALRERARLCLLAAGFNSRESVLLAITEGLDIAILSNGGNRVKTEVAQWKATADSVPVVIVPQDCIDAACHEENPADY